MIRTFRRFAASLPLLLAGCSSTSEGLDPRVLPAFDELQVAATEYMDSRLAILQEMPDGPEKTKAIQEEQQARLAVQTAIHAVKAILILSVQPPQPSEANS